jgi:type IX secretion system PorP/SprF family membrane protein
MKNIFKLAFILVVATFNANAQQDPMVTQYMFNGLYLNPAYAGSHDYWSSTLSYRTQWVGADFEGAPQTAIVAVDGPINSKNMGLGVIVYHDQIGVTKTNTVMANYAYQIKLNQKSKLAFGINAGVSQHSARLTDVLIWDEQDQVYANNLTKTIPRVGLGAYYYSDRHYVGFSVPTLLAYEDGNAFSMDLSKASFLRRHYLLTGGVVFNVSENVKLKPSVLLKYVPSAPLEGDVNFSAVFNDAFWVGATYRTNDAVSLLFEYQSNKFFRIGYAYDITISGLRGYQNGSHEIMIGVDFGKDLVKVKTPRYF